MQAFSNDLHFKRADELISLGLFQGNLFWTGRSTVAGPKSAIWVRLLHWAKFGQGPTQPRTWVSCCSSRRANHHRPKRHRTDRGMEHDGSIDSAAMESTMDDDVGEAAATRRQTERRSPPADQAIAGADLLRVLCDDVLVRILGLAEHARDAVPVAARPRAPLRLAVVAQVRRQLERLGIHRLRR